MMKTWFSTKNVTSLGFHQVKRGERGTAGSGRTQGGLHGKRQVFHTPSRLAGRVSPAEERWVMRLESSEKQQMKQHENTTHGEGSDISKPYT